LRVVVASLLLIGAVTVVLTADPSHAVAAMLFLTLNLTLMVSSMILCPLLWHLTRCPRCGEGEVKPFARKRRFGRCPACGRHFERSRGGLWREMPADVAARRPWRPIDRPLQPGALQAEVDATPCGALLGTKRRIDPTTLIRRVEKGSHADRQGKDKAEPIGEPGETSCGRLLRSQRRRNGQEAPPSHEGSLWDRWLDGGSGGATGA
jgi:hypothetical protein